MNVTIMVIDIIGCGIMGLMCAYFLQEKQVRVFDKQGFPAANASYNAGGMIAQYVEREYYRRSMWHLLTKGSELLLAVCRDLNISTEYKQNGTLVLHHDGDRSLVERLKLHIDNDGWQEIHTDQLVILEPDLSGKFKHGLYFPKESHLVPKLFIRSMLHHLTERGIQFIKQEVLPKSSNHWVIDCRGIDASDVLKDLRGVLGESVLLKTREISLKRPIRVIHSRYPIYVVPHDENNFYIGATILEKTRGYGLSVRSYLELLTSVYGLDSRFGEAEVIDSVHMLRPSYPDGLPKIIVDVKRRMISCNGLFRCGFILAPVIAMEVKNFLENDRIINNCLWQMI